MNLSSRFGWMFALAGTGLFIPAAQGTTLLASYQFEAADPLVNSAGATTYRPNLLNPGGLHSPTLLPGGGVNGTDAFVFDGLPSPAEDYLTFGGAGYLFLGYGPSITPGPSDPQNHDYTFSFWIKTGDSTSNTGGYAGTPEIPLLGDTSGGVAFSLGIDGGTPSFRFYSGGWNVIAGSKPVADGDGHYVTFVAHGNHTLLDIYVDGQLDIANQPFVGAQLDGEVGRSYPNHGGAFTLDDMTLYDSALDPATIAQLFAVPEPASLALAALGAVFVLRRRQR